MKINYLNYLKEGYFRDVTVKQEKKSKESIMSDISKMAKNAIKSKIEYLIQKYRVRVIAATNMFEISTQISGKFILDRIDLDIDNSGNVEKITIIPYFGALMGPYNKPARKVNFKLNEFVYDTSFDDKYDRNHSTAEDAVLKKNFYKSTIDVIAKIPEQIKKAAEKERNVCPRSDVSMYDMIIKSDLEIGKIHLFSNPAVYTENTPLILTTTTSLTNTNYIKSADELLEIFFKNYVIDCPAIYEMSQWICNRIPGRNYFDDPELEYRSKKELNAEEKDIYRVLIDKCCVNYFKCSDGEDPINSKKNLMRYTELRSKVDILDIVFDTFESMSVSCSAAYTQYYKISVNRTNDCNTRTKVDAEIVPKRIWIYIGSSHNNILKIDNNDKSYTLEPLNITVQYLINKLFAKDAGKMVSYTPSYDTISINKAKPSLILDAIDKLTNDWIQKIKKAYAL